MDADRRPVHCAQSPSESQIPSIQLLHTRRRFLGPKAALRLITAVPHTARYVVCLSSLRFNPVMRGRHEIVSTGEDEYST